MLNILSLESKDAEVILTVKMQDTTIYDSMSEEYLHATGYIKLFGIVYVKSSWSSDTKTICYKKVL